jgi:hypothetical protein
MGIAFLVITPWLIRNYLVFGTYVPMRTAAGWNSFAGIVSTASIVSPEKLKSQTRPPLKVDSINEAVTQNRRRKIPLDRFQMDYAIEVGGAKFIKMNEAQRDSWFLAQTKKFIRANPIMSAKIALWNEKSFVLAMGFTGIFVCLFAALGALLSIRTPLVLILAVWAGTYIGPFLMIVCYYSRYRAPIEPLLILLMLFAFWRLFRIGRHVFRIGHAH